MSGSALWGTRTPCKAVVSIGVCVPHNAPPSPYITEHKGPNTNSSGSFCFEKHDVMSKNIMHGLPYAKVRPSHITRENST